MAWFDDLDLPGSTITGRFAFVHEDGSDEDDAPDLRLASGAVTFKPTAKAVRAGGAWIGIAPVTAQITEGELVIWDEEGPLPLRLLSTDADTGVEGWGWEATFSIDGASIKPIRFRAPATGVHLTGDDLIPITGNPVEVIHAGASTWDNVSGKPAEFPPTVHEHSIEQVAGLAAALAGKQPAGDYATEQYVQDQVNAMPTPDLSGLVASSTVTSIWTGTAAEYAAVSSKDPATLYLIT